MRKFGIAAAGLALALGSAVLAPQAASAATAQPDGAYGCAGSQVGTYTLNYNGAVWGHAYLYYSSASGGTNCAVYVTAQHVGTKRLMDVWMRFHNDLHGGVEDNNYYAFYAGPVRLTNTDGRCLDVGYDDTNPTTGTGFGTYAGGVACG